MTKVTFPATVTVTAPALRAIAKSQHQLSDAQSELATGRLANLNAALGIDAKRSVNLRQEKSHLTSIIDANAVVKARIDGSIAALSTVAATAEELLSGLLNAGSDQVEPQILVDLARNGLATITNALNTTIDGVHLFSGANTDIKPIADYMSNPTSAARSALAAEFTSAFGMSNASSNMAAISVSSMQAFLDTTFKESFGDAAWQANWSEASDQPVRSRISTQQILETSVSASDMQLRDIFRAFTMIADLGIGGMSSATRSSVVASATKAVSAAISGTTSLSSRLGLASAVTVAANEQMAVSMHLMDQFLSAGESIDPTEVASRISLLTRDLEAAYQIVARLNSLSLLDVM